VAVVGRVAAQQHRPGRVRATQPTMIAGDGIGCVRCAVMNDTT
jgi:hypothetical protein